jgi:hypothetical protein
LASFNLWISGSYGKAMKQAPVSGSVSGTAPLPKTHPRYSTDAARPFVVTSRHAARNRAVAGINSGTL